MGMLSIQWRARAAEVDAQLPKLIGDANRTVEAAKAAIVPELLNAMADMLDALESGSQTEQHAGALKGFLKRNDDMRKAAVKAFESGNWDEFDKLAYGEPPTP